MSAVPERLWVLDAAGSDDPEQSYWDCEPPGWDSPKPWPPRNRVTVYNRADLMPPGRPIDDEAKAADMILIFIPPAGRDALFILSWWTKGGFWYGTEEGEEPTLWWPMPTVMETEDAEG